MRSCRPARHGLSARIRAHQASGQAPRAFDVDGFAAAIRAAGYDFAVLCQHTAYALAPHIPVGYRFAPVRMSLHWDARGSSTFGPGRPLTAPTASPSKVRPARAEKAAGPAARRTSAPARARVSPWYNPDVLVLAALATWLVLSALVAVLVCLVCRAGHAEDVARRYVED